MFTNSSGYLLSAFQIKSSSFLIRRYYIKGVPRLQVSFRSGKGKTIGEKGSMNIEYTFSQLAALEICFRLVFLDLKSVPFKTIWAPVTILSSYSLGVRSVDRLTVVPLNRFP